jgi:Aerotolerance regulator N-terminal
MLELFVNPFSMAIGGALISSPIIIHLINRMRFRRIRWAAMEFLLKSQKRNRRRLIIEQLILLFLRILIVLLVGLLLARFLGWAGIAGEEKQQTMHVILLDDTPSMGDFWREEGQQTDSFAEAKRLIVEKIATPAGQAPTPQLAEVVRLSELENPRSFGRLNATTVEELRTYLNPLKPSPLRVGIPAGLARAKALLDDAPKMRRVLHIVGDFRSVDWSSSDQEALAQTFKELEDAKIKVFLIDAAHPEVGQSQQKAPLYHDNIGIIDLRPETKVAPRFAPVEFTVLIANYSNSERKNVRVGVRINGQDHAEASVNISTLPANEITTARFTAQLDRIGTEEAPLERFNLVSAHLENEQAGLAIDNARYAVVEVRDRVPLLLVESKPGSLRREGSGQQRPANREAESFYLYKLFTEPLKGYDVRVRTAADLEKVNLRQYVSVILCGVPRLSDPAVKNLEEYVAGGGGAAFFLGPDIKIADADFYNERLYADGKGLFPLPIQRQPVNYDKKDEDIVPSKWSRRLSGQQQIFPRDKQHPALESLYADGGRVRSDVGGFDRILNYVVIDRYFQVNRLAWKRDDSTVQEIMTLPNLKPMDNYTQRVENLLKRLPLDDEKYADYKEVLTEYYRDLRTLAASNQPLFALAKRLEEMLTDDGNKEKRRPSLRAFWQRPEMADLARELQSMLDEVKFGDPLYVAKQYGIGRVIACTTSAGASWNDLEGLSLSHYPPLMMSLQRYLASAGTDINLIVGTPYEYRLGATQFAPRVKSYLLAQTEEKLLGGQPTGATITPQGEQALDVKEIPVGPAGEKEKQLLLPFADGKQPGAYIFEFSEVRPSDPAKGEGPQFRPEYRALVYNVDAKTEGDLRRTGRDELKRVTKGEVVGLKDEGDAIATHILDKKSDLSESPWLFLALLLVLVAEQAMAVRLSFHTNPGDVPPVKPVGA